MWIPEHFGQVNLKFAGAALPHGAQVTWGFLNTMEGSPSQVAEAIKSAISGATVMAILTSQVQIASILVKLGPNETGPSIEVAGNLVGGASSPPTTPNTALLVRKNTAAGGHSGSGRMFWPGWVEPNVEPNGTIAQEALTSAQNIFDDLLEGLATAELGMTLLHTSQTNSLGPLPVASLKVQGVAATQRRRMRP